MKDFLIFIRTQGVVGLAVAFVLGVAVNELVKSLVDNVINPVVGIALGRFKELSDATFVIAEAEIRYGALITTLINFIIIALVVYIVVTKTGLDKLDKKKDE